MSNPTLLAEVGRRTEQGGIVCCSADLCGQITDRQLPWFRLIVGIFVAAQTMLLGMTINITAPEDPLTLQLLQGGMLAATLVVLALLGLPLAMEGARQLRQGRVTMELLFLLGIGGSLGISVWSMVRGTGPVYFEVVNVLVVVYSIGHAITSHSRQRAMAATQSMLQAVATACLTDGRSVPVTELRRGDRVRVMPGELIPVDGTIVEGCSLVRSTTFSGEWQSMSRRAGDGVLAGSGCEDGTVIVEASADGADRRIDRLAALIASACQGSSPMQRLADRFVRIFLPVVVLIGLATLLGWGIWGGQWHEAIFHALAVVLVACPCAAGLATPLATWTAVNQLAERGMMVKSADALQRLAAVRNVIFDKTGTLSDERLDLVSLQTAPDPRQRQATLTLLAEVERHSEHPVAKALQELPRGSTGGTVEVRSVRTLPGRGIEAEVHLDGGPRRIVSITRTDDNDQLTIEATLDGLWIATARFVERMRQGSAAAVNELRQRGYGVQIMTGDASLAAHQAAALAPVTSGMTAEEKHAATRASGDQRTLFVGDGVNDAAAMAASYASIAMASGAEITLETADATLHGGDLRVIPEALDLSRRAVETIRSNFGWAVLYNCVGMILAVSGILHPIVAALLMSISSGIVAWRSFALSGRFWTRRQSSPAQVVWSEPAAASARSRTLPRWVYGTLHAVGLIGQGMVLIVLAQLGWLGSAATLAILLLITWAIIRWADSLPAWADMTLGMLSLGGLGMNLGWWIDLNFDPAIQNGTVMACCMARKTIEATSLEASSHWMYWLMLIVGVPAMYILRRSPITFDYRRFCCTGMLVLGVPGMCFGMWAGAQMAAGLTHWPGEMQVVASYVLMIGGMCAGMLVPHALELVRWR